MKETGKPGFKRVLVAVALCIGGVVVAAQFEGRGASAAKTVAPAEKFRLVQALGNSENIAASGLSRSECERQKSELKAVSTAIGSYNEATGYGSITCLPESYFND